MHPLKIAVLATVATAVSAENCNPSYNTTSAGECFDNCNSKAGKGLYSDWTDDSTSPNFLKSLSYMCNKGTSEYIAFMTTAGMCMVSCSNPDLFATEFSSACAWWQEHKNDTCSASNTSTSSNTTSSPSQSVAAASDSSKLSSFAFNIQTCAIAFAGIATYFLI
ncbi:hypothetical protein CU098_006081 [Rhizopus stolonifer]|uniref:Secreted protein n=1 Tax=Rhizopus stolonifer TaxID=4846 RepID=A0A367IN06_RHIST|nr:hypothetical protein CU098_006081 [Rhizopus stolonifer]